MTSLIALLAADRLSDSDVSTILLVVALLCLCGAAYMAYLRNALACGLLVLVAIVAFVLS